MCKYFFVSGPNFLAHNAPKIEKECHFKCILVILHKATQGLKLTYFEEENAHFCKFSRIFCTIFAGYYYSPLCVHSSRRCRRVLVSFISSSSSSNPAVSVKPNVMKRRTQTAHYVLVRRYRRGFH